MTLIGLFLVVFVLGPLAFWLLTVGPFGQTSQRLLGAGTAVLALSGLGLRYGFGGLWGRDIGLTVVSIALIWAAWIGILAYSARALQRVDPGARMRRWTAVIGAACTTVPWFGLVSANLIQG